MADLPYSSSSRPPPAFFQKVRPPVPRSDFDAWAAERLLALSDEDLSTPERTIGQVVYPSSTLNSLNNADFGAFAAGAMANTLALATTDNNAQQWVLQVPVGNFWTAATAGGDLSVWLDSLKVRISAHALAADYTAPAITNKRIGFRMLVVDIDHAKSNISRVKGFGMGVANSVLTAGPTWHDFLQCPNQVSPSSILYGDAALPGELNGLSERGFNSPLRPVYQGPSVHESDQMGTAYATVAKIVPWTGRYSNNVASTASCPKSPLDVFFKDVFGEGPPVGAPPDVIYSPSPFHYKVLCDQQFFLEEIGIPDVTDETQYAFETTATTTSGITTEHFPNVETSGGRRFRPRGGKWEVLVPVRKWYDWMPIPSDFGSTETAYGLCTHSVWILLMPNQGRFRSQGASGSPALTFDTRYDRIPNVHVMDMTVEQCYQEEVLVYPPTADSEYQKKQVDGLVDKRFRHDVGSDPRDLKTLKRAR